MLLVWATLNALRLGLSWWPSEHRVRGFCKPDDLALKAMEGFSLAQRANHEDQFVNGGQMRFFQKLPVFKLLLALCCTLPCHGALWAQASNYPYKPVKFIVAFPAGSATDHVARLVANQMTKQTGQPIVVDNRGGANGFIACEMVAKAAPDGYTVLLTTGTTHSANPSLFKSLPYDPVNDFVPVTSLHFNVFIFVTSPNFPANSVQEFVKMAKANPDKYTFASANAPSRIGGEMFQMMSGTKLVHVPYKGAPQALTDIMGGQVSVGWSDLSTAVPLVKAGKLKALAFTGSERLAVMPQLPTMKEQGFPDYRLSNWSGAYLPAKTPMEIVNKLNALIHAAVNADRSSLEASGGQVLLQSSEEFAKLQASDAAMWSRVTKAAGMEME
jgi:tripartite-type tricarboxylate transporter receptor subunit TctC